MIQVDCTISIWPTSTYAQENVNLLTILHWWKAESTLQDKEMRGDLLTLCFHVHMPVIPLRRYSISPLATELVLGFAVTWCFIYFANTASKFSFPLEHCQGKSGINKYGYIMSIQSLAAAATTGSSE